jgi:ABC-type protease/lipase transport system fused ATPase/permease subunit
MFKDLEKLNNFLIFKKIKQIIFIIFLCSFLINFLTIAVSFYSMQIFDKVLNSSSLATLFYLTLLTIILIFFINFFHNFRNDLMQKINIIIQKKVLHKIQHLSDINKKIYVTQNLQKINGFFNGNSANCIFEISLSFFYIIAIFIISPILAKYALMALFTIIVFDNFHQKNILYLQQNLQKNHEKNLQNFLIFNRENILTKFNQIVQNIFQKWQNNYKFFINLELNYYKIYNKYLVASKNLRLLSQILATMICAYLVIRNQISVGSIIAVSILLSKFLEPFTNVTNNLKNFQDFIKNFKNIFKEIDAENDEEKPNLFLPKTFEKITFNKIFYRHQNDKNFIIQTENFTIETGKTIAILTSNGLEQEAIYNFFTKKYIPAFGEIKIDDCDLQKIPQKQLMDFIDLIENDPFLFDGNVLENIAKMSNNFSVENVLKFCKKFTFDFGLSTLKNGFFSDIKDLNNQQKYWVSSLRALYHSPKILFIEKLFLNENSSIFFDYLNDYKKSQNSIIFINNPPFELFKKTDYVIFFKNNFINLLNTKNFINSHEKTPKLLT